MQSGGVRRIMRSFLALGISVSYRIVVSYRMSSAERIRYLPAIHER